MFISVVQLRTEHWTTEYGFLLFSFAYVCLSYRKMPSFPINITCASKTIVSLNRVKKKGKHIIIYIIKSDSSTNFANQLIVIDDITESLAFHNAWISFLELCDGTLSSILELCATQPASSHIHSHSQIFRYRSHSENVSERNANDQNEIENKIKSESFDGISCSTSAVTVMVDDDDDE